MSLFGVLWVRASHLESEGLRQNECQSGDSWHFNPRRVASKESIHRMSQPRAQIQKSLALFWVTNPFCIYLLSVMNAQHSPGFIKLPRSNGLSCTSWRLRPWAGMGTQGVAARGTSGFRLMYGHRMGPSPEHRIRSDKGKILFARANFRQLVLNKHTVHCSLS